MAAHSFGWDEDGEVFCGRKKDDLEVEEESGLLCAKREIDGVEDTMVSKYIVESQVGERTGPYNQLEREISSNPNFFLEGLLAIVFRPISPVLACYTPPSSPWVLFYYLLTIYHNRYPVNYALQTKQSILWRPLGMTTQKHVEFRP